MTTFSEMWKQAGQPAAAEYMPPPGAMQVTIVEASAFAGRDTRQWAKCVLAVAAGPDVGRRFDHFMNLNNPVGMRIARESLLTYGIDPAALENEAATIDTLHEAMQPLVGVNAVVTIIHKDGFMNVRVDGAQLAGPELPAVPQPDKFGSEAPF